MDFQGIEFDHVIKSFGTLNAVDDVSLRIPHGTFVSFIGPSGCGKTTSLRLLAGFEVPNRGTILIDGRNVTAVPPNKRNISMVFQHYALFPHMNVRQNIEYGLRMRKVPPADRTQRIERVVSLLEIRDILDESPGRISGGQQQKVGLARALVTEPNVLLLDEPMGSIDEALRVRTQREIRMLFERLGITFIHVTHNQLEAFAMADRIVVMNKGKVVQDDTPENLFRHPDTDFVARFVGRNNIFYGRVTSRTDREWEVETPSGVFRVAADRRVSPPGERTAFSVRAGLADLRVNGAPGPENRVSGEVTFIEEVENIKIYHVLTDDGLPLRVEKHGMEGMASVPVGGQVSVAWRAEDAVLLRVID